MPDHTSDATVDIQSTRSRSSLRANRAASATRPLASAQRARSEYASPRMNWT